ncbi:hypothetical protein J5U18_09775 [Sphingobacteriaceae bacterium WQ 2009]|uniref:Uncharacterized protein n=2 Tax=Rhinopithecimicrobium faecis TaxID=2820698 RepID=A0A8T4HA14_9SPHI|nr:hypothetical protein [Sphingobacteriaceae bacterium WQ 2009]
MFSFVVSQLQNMICPLAEVEEVFVTPEGAVYQCSRKNCYFLDFAGNTTSFKINDFMSFKKQIDALDIEAMLSNAARSADFELIMPFRTERCFMLSVNDILVLREILDGAKFMILLNSEIKSCLRAADRYAVYA